jgi:hypothetical protein
MAKILPFNDNEVKFKLQLNYNQSFNTHPGFI